MQPSCGILANLAPCSLRNTTLGLLLTVASATAGNLQVAPILLEFSDGEQAKALWLENSGEQALHAQVRVQAWTQRNASDVLAPSQVLLASPAIIEIGAGQRQLVRIVRSSMPSPADTGREQAYRLLVDELPNPGDGNRQGLTFLLRYSIPVFLLPAGVLPREQRSSTAADTQALQINWRVDAGLLTLTLHNNGHQRVRLSQLRWLPVDGPAIELNPGLLGYVLAGQQMQWMLPLPASFPPTGTLQARLNDAAIPQSLRSVDL